MRSIANVTPVNPGALSRTCTLDVKQLMLLDSWFCTVRNCCRHFFPHPIVLGTVFNDVDKKGCIAVEKCPCVHNRKIFQPGESYKKPCKEW